MRRCGEFNVIFYAPKTETGQKELSQRVASVHADTVVSRLQKLTCPTAQKLQLLDAIITQSKYLQIKKGDKSL